MKALKMSGDSENQQEIILQLLREKLPEVFSEGKINIKQLRATLGEEVLTDVERYGLNWAGKMDCFRMIQETTTNTLKPVREESVDFDNTENLFIEGDNLEVLKVLQKSYYGKVKMIYIDPPYNTGNDFIYNDKFSRNKREYLEEVGAIDEDGNVVNAGLYTQNTKDGGHYHSAWLNMMYPRLFLAKNLLRKDGVIFISIDDHEVHNLRTVMNEIFGEENFIGQITWKARVKPVNIGDSKYSPQCEVEYVLIYQKTDYPGKFKPLITGGVRNYSHEINGRRYRLATVLKSNRGSNQRTTMTFSLNDYTPPEGQRWQAGEDVINHLWTSGYIEFVDGTPLRRYFEDEEGAEHDPFYCFMDIDWSSTSEVGKSELNNLLGNNHGFDTVKPLRLLKTLIQSCTSDDDIVMDFFAGSGTTAHAVMQLNAEDDGKRQWISVQLPEKCKPESESVKAGFVTIAEITKKRIRVAASKIREENSDKRLDLGFKMFKLSESNFKIWNTHVTSVEQLEQQMIEMFDNVQPGATKEAMMYELILKSGKELNVAIEEKEAGGEKYFKVNDGSLAICLADKLSKELFTGILAEKPKKIIVLDKSFGNDDQLKTNLLLQAEGAGVDEVRVI